MPRVYAECHMQAVLDLNAKCSRRRGATVEISMVAEQSASAQKPITLVIKGQNFHRVMELMNVFQQSDEDLAKAVERTMPGEANGRKIDEIAAWVRKNIVTELKEME